MNTWLVPKCWLEWTEFDVFKNCSRVLKDKRGTRSDPIQPLPPPSTNSHTCVTGNKAPLWILEASTLIEAYTLWALHNTESNQFKTISVSASNKQPLYHREVPQWKLKPKLGYLIILLRFAVQPFVFYFDIMGEVEVNRSPTECPLCYDNYTPEGTTQPRMIIPCGHTVCFGCITKLAAQTVMMCPICRKKCPSRHVVEH